MDTGYATVRISTILFLKKESEAYEITVLSVSLRVPTITFEHISRYL